MILQEEFEKNGYKDLLAEDNASKYKIDLDDIFETNDRPEELISIYISNQQDELFFLLDGDLMEINSLCDRWDNRIQVFSIINGKSEAFYKLKYNIIQLIIHSDELPDKNREGNLHITRKIIIRGDKPNKNQIVIDDNEAIELPFHMISPNTVVLNEEQVTRLKQLLPEDEELISIMEKDIKKVPHRGKKLVRDKSFEVQDFEMIKEWLN